ncbi:hypothetical protein FACS1894151_06720 [Spirochaetia bacterium]|nr:hypothetical protein FACS1894151_06720 [Spirochaetia bacterium]
MHFSSGGKTAGCIGFINQYVSGGRSTERVDCSGLVIVALQEMGYNISSNITVAEMVSGTLDWITITNGNTIEQSTPGTLNFYDWGKGIEHVNVGVGQRGNEILGQIVDATSNGWMVSRNSNPNQTIPAGEKMVNQTFTPYTTSNSPVIQGTINFDVLENCYK